MAQIFFVKFACNFSQCRIDTLSVKTFGRLKNRAGPVLAGEFTGFGQASWLQASTGFDADFSVGRCEKLRQSPDFEFWLSPDRAAGAAHLLISALKTGKNCVDFD